MKHGMVVDKDYIAWLGHDVYLVLLGQVLYGRECLDLHARQRCFLREVASERPAGKVEYGSAFLQEEERTYTAGEQLAATERESMLEVRQKLFVERGRLTPRSSMKSL